MSFVKRIFTSTFKDKDNSEEKTKIPKKDYKDSKKLIKSLKIPKTSKPEMQSIEKNVIGEIFKESASFRDEIQSLKTQNDELSILLGKTKEDLDLSTILCANYKTQTETLTNEVTMFKNKLNEINAINENKVKSAISSSSSNTDELKQIIKDLEIEKENQEKKQMRNEEKIKALISQRSKLESENDSFKLLVAKQNDKTKHYKNKVKKLTNTVRKIRNYKIEEAVENDTISKYMEEKNKTILQMKKSLEQSKYIISDVSKENKELNLMKQNLENEYQKYYKRYHQLESDVNLKDGKIGELNEKIISIEKEKNDHLKLISDLNLNVENLMFSNKQLGNEYKKLSEKYSEIINRSQLKNTLDKNNLDIPTLQYVEKK